MVKTASCPQKKLQTAAARRAAASAMELDARVDCITNLIKKKVEYCRLCEEALEEAGVDLESAMRETSKKEGKGGGKRKAGDGVPECLPRSSTLFGVQKLEVMQHICSCLEPLWSSHALAVLKTKKRGSIDKTKLQELIEFATGVGEDTFLGTETV
mmetsp:Transcript_30040/g.54754  ORF Transcript_30040/g.54754 Transcript_30040/m.54754 type:complete len:156 (-) Transcript_30040:864-1331(-)